MRVQHKGRGPYLQTNNPAIKVKSYKLLSALYESLWYISVEQESGKLLCGCTGTGNDTAECHLQEIKRRLRLTVWTVKTRGKASFYLSSLLAFISFRIVSLSSASHYMASSSSILLLLRSDSYGKLNKQEFELLPWISLSAGDLRGNPRVSFVILSRV